MNALLELSFEVRWLLVLLVGMALGSLINLAVYRLAWSPRPHSPWSAAPVGLPPRRWRQRVPVVGWLAMDRDPKTQGAGFWVRPLLIELTTGVLLAALYACLVDSQGLLPLPRAPLNAELNAQLHGQFLALALLMVLMLVASWIDIDEKLIPDTVTLPGTLLGLIAAVALPAALLPAGWEGVAPELSLTPLWFAPREDVYDFLLSTGSLAVGLGCLAMWCFALLPRPWRTRHGLGRALAILIARVRREPMSLLMLVIFVIGGGVIFSVWKFLPDRWGDLLSALIGLAAAGGLVWAVRIIGTLVLGREAMGFGDVTLMAMIGAFVGWQASLVIFFLAPLAGLVIGAVNWFVHRDQEIPYGPFLCLAAMVVIFAWRGLWERVGQVFSMGYLVPAAVGVCLVLMAVLLGLLQVLKRRMGVAE